MTVEEQQPDEVEDHGGNREAAKWRTRLRTVEGERDALAARVAAYTRADVERRVSERLADADDFFVLGQVDVADLVDDEGNVDAAKVDAAVDELLERRPKLAKDWEPDVTDLDAGARRTTPRSTSWSSVLSGGRA